MSSIAQGRLSPRAWCHVTCLALLLAGCRVDSPDLGGYQFACEEEGPGGCPAGQTCQDGICVPTTGDAGAGDAGGDGAAVDPSLIAHLPLDLLDGDETPDVAGMHDATCVGGNCPSTVGGQIGGALSFDGVDDGMELASGSTLDPVRGTVAVWLYLPAHPAAGATVSVVGKAYGDGIENAYELWVDDGGKLYLFAAGSHLDAPTPLEEGRWTHVAATWGDDTLRLYVDGEEENTSSGTPLFDDSPVLLGMDRNNGIDESFLTGRLDDVRIHDRVLSAAEIAALAAPGE